MSKPPADRCFWRFRGWREGDVPYGTRFFCRRHPGLTSGANECRRFATGAWIVSIAPSRAANCRLPGEKNRSQRTETNHGRVIISLGDLGRMKFTLRLVLASRVCGMFKVERAIFLVQYPSV